MLQLGLLLALVGAFVTNLGMLWKHKGVVDIKAVEFNRPWQSMKLLFGSKWYAIGWIVTLSAFVFHALALLMAPLSLVQAVLSGGLVFLAVLATKFFGFKLGKREWGGIGLVAAGLTFLGLTVHAAAGHAHYSLAAMIAFEAGLVAVGSLMLFSHRVKRVSNHHGMMLGAATGILFGVSDVAIKAITISGLLSPWFPLAIAIAIVAFFTSARSLQLGDGVSILATTTIAANVTAIVGGVLVFSDPLGSSPLMVIGHVLAFVLVIAAAALIPAPKTRAAALPAVA